MSDWGTVPDLKPWQKEENEMSDWKQKTVEHIHNVRKILFRIGQNLEMRGIEHDESKLFPPEGDTFAEFTDKLKGTTFGSDEYKKYLAKMKPALDHHYAENIHHPEHFENGIEGMTLVDLVEMLADWKAATLRHADGDIWESLEIQREKLGLSDQLAKIFANTIPVIEEALTDAQG